MVTPEHTRRTRALLGPDKLLLPGHFAVVDTDSASDRLLDALVAHGDPPAVARGLLAHIEAGADHVGVYPVGDDPVQVLLGVAAQWPAPEDSG
ncbi:hypothetical protein ACQP1W_22555 [Spirillospora sp. CA-255316]